MFCLTIQKYTCDNNVIVSSPPALSLSPTIDDATMDVMQVNTDTDDTTTRNVHPRDMEWGSSQLNTIEKELDSSQPPTPKKRGRKGKDTPPTPPTRRSRRNRGQPAGKEAVNATTTLGGEMPTATITQDGGDEIDTTPIPTRTPVAATLEDNTSATTAITQPNESEADGTTTVVNDTRITNIAKTNGSDAPVDNTLDDNTTATTIVQDGKYTDITKLSFCQFCNPHVFLIYQLWYKNIIMSFL